MPLSSYGVLVMSGSDWLAAFTSTAAARARSGGDGRSGSNAVTIGSTTRVARTTNRSGAFPRTQKG